ncbi:Peptidyl-tRNA hydrolase protein 2, mitochondrial [Kappamyces sp. JEL0680]|nr:Peptidyl-tRNA hydrolase protein 2, mitochondrial [Kappamyces sp. JEL0680]
MRDLMLLLHDVRLSPDALALCPHYYGAVLLGAVLGWIMARLWIHAWPAPARLPASGPSHEDTDDESESPVQDEREEVKLVLVVRTDLGMGKGKVPTVAAQCSHATLAAYQKASKKSDRTRKWIRDWEKWGAAKITVKCQDEAEMLALETAAKDQGLVAASIQDAGRTQIAAGSRTVLAIGPGPKSWIDKVSGHLKLY